MSAPAPAERTVCLRAACQAISEGAHASCPVCGGEAIRQEVVRTLGWVLVACGLFLTLIGAVLAWFMAPTLLAPGEWIGDSVFDGTEQQGWLILGIFGVLVLLGVAALAAGYSQIVHGKRDPGATAWVLALAAGLYLAGIAIEAGWLA